MSQSALPPQVRIENIFHPSDFSAASEIAFHHALKFALAAQATLSVLHVADDPQVDWADFPGVRDTLERWGLIPPGSPRGAVAELGIRVRKAVSPHRDPVRAALAFLEQHPTDLIVLATHQHQGRTSWLQQSVAEPIARESGQMTLFIPHGCPGFVAREDGATSLRQILIPVAPAPRPQPAIEAAARAIRSLGAPSGKVTLLYVGAAGDQPAVQTPEIPGWQWERVARPGDVVEEILAAARAGPADVIAMTTDGHHGFLDALRGSSTERVLRQTQCPLLAIPVGSLLG